MVATPNAEFVTEVDRAGRSEWTDWLDQFSDANIYQTWAYGTVRWGESNLSRIVLRRQKEVVAIAQLRIARPVGKLRCGVAYLRWGPLWQNKSAQPMNAGALRTLADAIVAEYVVKRGLFLRILPNAFIGTAQADAIRTAFTSCKSQPFGPTETYRTFRLDLTPPLEQLRKQLDQKWRNQLNRAEKNGLTVVASEGPEQFDEFICIYDEMLARKKFETSTDVHEFRRIQAELPPQHRLKLLLCKKDDVVVTGLIGTGMGDTGIYLFGATSDQGLQLKGAYLLQWTMIQWLKEQGIRYYNLGGANPQRNPGVFHFKEGMSGQDVLYEPALVACQNPVSRAFVRATALASGPLRQKLNQLARRK